jgi:hypothetical protein
VAYLFRYREISLQANARYLDALAAVDDPTAGKKSALQNPFAPSDGTRVAPWQLSRSHRLRVRGMPHAANYARLLPVCVDRIAIAGSSTI